MRTWTEEAGGSCGRTLVDGRPVPAGPDLWAEDAARGCGAFTTLRVHRGRPLFLADHLERLERTAAVLGLACPGRAAVTGEIGRAALDAPDARVRVALLPAGRGAVTRVVFAEPWEASFPPWRIVPALLDTPPAHPQLKTTRRLPYRQARRRVAGDDALVVDAAGRYLECTVANFFLVCGSRLRTPPASEPLLPGIARRHVLAWAPDAGLAAEEAPLGPDDVRSADACFVTNAVLLAHAVAEVAGVARFGACPLVETVHDALLGRGVEGV
ncbi:MAG: aminotransferase class IV [Planctomycetota bacterium]